MVTTLTDPYLVVSRSSGKVNYHTGKKELHVDTADTAKLVRIKLKNTFSWVKFKVRISRYSGGSSIYVSWNDGPTEAMVQATCEEFRGDYFDGMIDYHGYVKREVNGEEVHYSGSLSFQRHVSKELFLAVANAFEAKNGRVPEIVDLDGAWPHFEMDFNDQSWYTWANQELRDTAVTQDGRYVIVKVKNQDTGNITRTY
jgi:hypothetical protein